MTAIAVRLRTDAQLRRYVVGIACLLAAIAITVVVTRDPGTEGADGGPLLVGAGTAVTDPVSGMTWEAPHGTWSIGRRTRVVAPDVIYANLLTTRTGTPNYTVKASLIQESTFSGIVFRYRNDSDYWFVQAAPNFGTWRIVRVIDGVSQGIGPVGELTCCRPGVVLAVSTDRDGSMVFSVDGVLITELDDPLLAGADGVGFLASDVDAQRARFANLEIIHQIPSRERDRASADGA